MRLECRVKSKQALHEAQNKPVIKKYKGDQICDVVN